MVFTKYILLAGESMVPEQKNEMEKDKRGWAIKTEKKMTENKKKNIFSLRCSIKVLKWKYK